MTKYLVFLFCFFSFSANAQSKCDCFDRLYRLSSFEIDDQKSIDMLKDAISFLDSTQKGEYYWKVAEQYKGMKQYDSSAEWYLKALKWGYGIESLKWYSPEVYSRMDTTMINMISFENRKKVNFYLYEKFISQNALDQAIRYDVLFSGEKYWDTSAPVCERSFVDSIYHRVDDSTFRFLKWVFDNYRFPTFRQLGFFPRGIGGMIMHVTAYNNENATYVLNKLEEFSNNCEYQKSDILFLKDRQKHRNENKSYCGLIGPGQRFLYIEDVNKADSIRFAYNQVRLKEEAAAWGGQLKLPDNYKPRPYPKNYFCLKKYQIE